MNTILARDERERSTDDRADHWAFLVLAFGLLGIVAYRAFVDHVSSWDLLGLVVAAGLVGTAYRLRARVASPAWASVGVGALLIAAALAIVLGLLLRGGSFGVS